MNSIEKTALRESISAFTVQECSLIPVSESTLMKFSDDSLSHLMAFISPKYNEVDFGEIQQSSGDYRKFKHAAMLNEATSILDEMYRYSNVSPEKMSKSSEVLYSITNCLNFLTKRADDIHYLYSKEFAQTILMYDSMLAACIVGLNNLISATISFINSEDGTDSLDLKIEELPSYVRSSIFRSLVNYGKLISDGSMDKFIDLQIKSKDSILNEAAIDILINESFLLPSLTVTSLIKFAAIPMALILLSKIIPITREIIYSIYYARVKISEALKTEAQLIRVNVGAIEYRMANGDPKNKKRLGKVMGKQKAVATALETMASKIAIKSDDAEPMVTRQINIENKTINIKSTGVEVAPIDDLIL